MAEKSILDALLDKMRQQRAQQQQAPETSYFADKPEPDRELERRQAAARRAEEEKHRAARITVQWAGPPLSPKERVAHDIFKHVTMEEGARRQKNIEARFSHTETQAAALQVMLDADEMRDDADQVHAEKMAKIYKPLERLDWTKPIPEDYGRDINEQIQRQMDAHKSRVESIKRRAEQALSEILKIDNEITLGQRPLQITQQPLWLEDAKVVYVPPGGFTAEDHIPSDEAHDVDAASNPDGEPQPSDYRSIFEAIARPAQQPARPDMDAPSYDM